MDKVILILGGNGFIGAECVETILNTFGDEYKLILVNRGNWDDWDAKSRIKSRIHDNIIFDRSCDKPEKLRESLGKYLSNEQFAFEAIIDFSGFKSKELSRILDAIPSEKIKVYIYISTDSVYEVSKLEKPLNSRLEEVDSIRPDSEEERKKLKKLDSYAHHKLKCEELLLERAKETKLPFVMLRLPDVLGERDSSHRFWQVQMQLEYLEYLKPNETHQIEISKPFYELKTSYVNVKDIAKSIVYFLKSNIRNEIFNIGFEQSLSLIEFYQVLAHSIKPGLEKRLEFKAVERHIYHPFPSVTKGPVSIEKIKTMTGFQPSDLESFFSECVAFYRDAFMKYPKMRLQVEKEVKKDMNIKSDESKEEFEKFIKNYKVNY